MNTQPIFDAACAAFEVAESDVYVDEGADDGTHWARVVVRRGPVEIRESSTGHTRDNARERLWLRLRVLAA